MRSFCTPDGAIKTLSLSIISIGTRKKDRTEIHTPFEYKFPRQSLLPSPAVCEDKVRNSGTIGTFTDLIKRSTQLWNEIRGLSSVIESI